MLLLLLQRRLLVVGAAVYVQLLRLQRLGLQLLLARSPQQLMLLCFLSMLLLLGMRLSAGLLFVLLQ